MHHQVVAAVICDGNKYLCVKRPQGKYAYTSCVWEFPGGKVEAGETEPEALVREIHEEMGYDIHVVRHLVTVHHQYPDFSISLSAYLCQPSGAPNAFVLHEHTNHCWLSALDLSSLQWSPADVGIVDALVEMESQNTKD